MHIKVHASLSHSAQSIQVLDKAGDTFKVDESIVKARNALISRNLKTRSIMGEFVSVVTLCFTTVSAEMCDWWVCGVYVCARAHVWL